jgi:hypothetical protein
MHVTTHLVIARGLVVFCVTVVWGSLEIVAAEKEERSEKSYIPYIGVVPRSTLCVWLWSWKTVFDCSVRE